MEADEMNQDDISFSDEKKEATVKLPAINFFKINFISFLVPFYPCLGLFLLFEYYFITLFSIPLIFHFLILPGFLLFLYYTYLIILIEFCRFWTSRWNKKSPPIQGVFPRILDNVNSPEGKLIKYYHNRGFIVKYPIWLTSKSPFPWLVNRALRRISHNKISRNVIYCDCYVGLEFTNLEENVFIYPTTALSAHEVNTIFGKITMLEIALGKNTTLYPGIIVGPGALTTDNSVIYPNTVLHKNWRGKPGKFYYQGSPGHPIEINLLEDKNN